MNEPELTRWRVSTSPVRERATFSPTAWRIGGRRTPRPPAVAGAAAGLPDPLGRPGPRLAAAGGGGGGGGMVGAGLPKASLTTVSGALVGVGRPAARGVFAIFDDLLFVLCVTLEGHAHRLSGIHLGPAELDIADTTAAIRRRSAAAWCGDTGLPGRPRLTALLLRRLNAAAVLLRGHLIPHVFVEIIEIFRRVGLEPAFDRQMMTGDSVLVSARRFCQVGPVRATPGLRLGRHILDCRLKTVGRLLRLALWLLLRRVLQNALDLIGRVLKLAHIERSLSDFGLSLSRFAPLAGLRRGLVFSFSVRQVLTRLREPALHNGLVALHLGGFSARELPLKRFILPLKLAELALQIGEPVIGGFVRIRVAVGVIIIVRIIDRDILRLRFFDNGLIGLIILGIIGDVLVFNVVNGARLTACIHVGNAAAHSPISHVFLD